MALNLFSHNQKAYDAAEYLLEKEKRAAIIHPTGTGKSMIAFQLVLNHTDCRVLWLAPSEYIFQTQTLSKKIFSISVYLLQILNILVYNPITVY